MLFFDRQWLLQVLYDQLQRKDKIFLRNRVTVIGQDEDGVQVTTTGRQVYTGDIVIGGDGIRSVVRRETRLVAALSRSIFLLEKRIVFLATTSAVLALPKTWMVG